MHEGQCDKRMRARPRGTGKLHFGFMLSRAEVRKNKLDAYDIMKVPLIVSKETSPIILAE